MTTEAVAPPFGHRCGLHGSKFAEIVTDGPKIEHICHFSQADPSSQAPASGSAAKLDQVQDQVNEVKVILKDNISKVLERGDRLDDLIGKTDDLQASVSIVMVRGELSTLLFVDEVLMYDLCTFLRYLYLIIYVFCYFICIGKYCTFDRSTFQIEI